MESAQIPESTENGIAKNGYNVYVDTTNYSGKTRDNLLAYLSNESTNTSGIWSGFAEGVETALNAKLAAGQKLTAGTVKAYGAPTVEQFQGSYDENHPGDEFRAKYVTDLEHTYKDDTNSTTKAYAVGYVFKKKDVDWSTSVTLGNTNKGLYFPVTSTTKETSSQTNDTYGYLLARFFGPRLQLCGESGLLRRYVLQRL